MRFICCATSSGVVLLIVVANCSVLVTRIGAYDQNHVICVPLKWRPTSCQRHCRKERI